MAKASSKLLKKFLNKEIPDDDYIFRRVPLSIFLECRPDHKFVICPQFFRNENGDGMSVDWERLCKDPKVTQTRNGKQPDTHGIIFLSVFDVKKFREQLLKIINDQMNYNCHCLVQGIPMSLGQLERKNKSAFKKLSNEERSRLHSLLVTIREHLCDHAYWIIPILNSKLANPPSDFKYQDEVKKNKKIEKFFSTRKFPIPS